MNETRRILALAAHPERSAATRFRLTQMLPYLRARNIEVDFQPFMEEEFFEEFYVRSALPEKAAYLARRALGRLALAAIPGEYAGVFVQREASLVGPAYAEFILGAVRRLPIVFDFDDAIWIDNAQQSTYPLATRILKRPSKCWSTMRRAACIIAGSRHLGAQASAVSDRVEVVPTVVPSKVWTPFEGRFEGLFVRPERPVIGWVGSHSTAHQLDLVAPALRQLRAEGHVFEVRVVGAARDFALDGVKMEAREWSLSNEVREFQELDIGVAPMHQGPLYEGKCGFKQLQYMAVGVPCVTSMVGGARDFVQPDENALVAETEQDWYPHLKALLVNHELRARLSRAGRQLVESQYCLEVQGPVVARLVESALD